MVVMRKTALLLALLLLLSSCGAPVQEPPEPSAAKPSAVPWEGRGEGFTTGSGFVASGLGDSYLYLA